MTQGGTAQRGREGRDAGAGTVLVLGLVAVAMAALVLVAGVGTAALTGARAASAADLAALAGADVVLGRAGGTACEAAGRTAAANGAVLSSCALLTESIGGSSVVTSVQVGVSVTAPGAVGRLGSARASARAGLAARDPGSAQDAAASVGSAP